MLVPVQAFRKPWEANPPGSSEARWGGKLEYRTGPVPYCREKPLAIIHVAPVPQTDTGRRGENPKARGITLVKELGKITP